ncbi:MAG: 23S rRNA (uracil(1939)-C(5))-methyltransferase RlmD [Lachnospiraceae bacterium]|nr:23S rRNA (uracil(1939)-C(5))-methyltransferase RlmD [Lachnospiraceae bacterium]
MYKKNDILEIKITDMTNEGEGVGKHDGFAFFVKDTVIGDVASVRVTKLKKSYGYARLEKIIDPSPDRVRPFCRVHRQCGGCQIQCMSYEAQLRFKGNKVKNNLIRIGGFDAQFLESIAEPINGMDVSKSGFVTGYRNKAQFPVGKDKNGRIITGFYAGRTHSIIENTDCMIGVPENRLILEKIISFMNEEGISAYDESLKEGLVRHILIRKGFYSNEIMVCIVINGKNIPEKEKFVSSLTSLNAVLKNEYGSSIESISLSENTKDTNVIMGESFRTLWGKDTIEDKLMGLTFSISPLSFYQVNPVQTEKLYSQALSYADIQEGEEVWDICCGIGTITLAMSKKARMVHGIEIVPEAIEDAVKNAKANGILNSEFICAPAEKYLPEHSDEIQADVIVMDPPRKGMDLSALSAILKVSPKKIVYVSCDSATLARDLKYLCENGYELKKYRPFDLFPNTIHVETVCLLSKLSEAKNHISVQVDMDELDVTAAESKATYEEIQEWVQEKYGFHVTHLNIAKTKRKCGIIERQNYNLPKSGDSRSPETPKEKEKAIIEAFRHFQMI